MEKSDTEFVVRMIIEGGIWATRPVAEDPQICLCRWSVVELTLDGETTRHFVGYNMEGGEGRVSSPIVEFDATALRGKTRSGRVYELVGRPGWDSDGSYVLDTWIHLHGFSSCHDVTDEILIPGGPKGPSNS